MAGHIRTFHLVCLAAVLLWSARAAAQEQDQEPEGVGASVTATPRRGLIIEGADGTFRFELHVQAVTRLELTSFAGRADELYFDVPDVRPQFVFKALDSRLELLVEPELAGAAARLLDLRVDVELSRALGLRAGRFRTPFSRAFMTSSAKLQFPERGLVNDYFSPGRDIGVMAYRRPTDRSFEVYAGVFNGAGTPARIGDTPFPLLMGRVVVSPYGSVPYNQAPLLEDLTEREEPPSGISIGLNGYVMERRLVEGELPAFMMTGGIDVAAAHGGLSLLTEAYVRVTEDGAGLQTTSRGAYGQIGYFITPYELEVAARVGWLDPNRLRDGRVMTYEAVLNRYLVYRNIPYGQHIKMSLRYLVVDADAPILDLPSGTSHRLTALLQLWF